MIPTNEELAQSLLKQGIEDDRLGFIASEACELLDVDCVLISFFDSDKSLQNIAAAAGPLELARKGDQFDASTTLCGAVFISEKPLAVPDTSSQVGNGLPAVEPEIGAYLGFPIFDDNGVAIGTICAIASQPRQWDEATQRRLKNFGDWAADFTNSSLAMLRYKSAVEREQDVLRDLVRQELAFGDFARNLPGAIFRYCLHKDGSDSIDFLSPGCEIIWGYSADELMGDPSLLWDCVYAEDIDAMRASVDQSAESLKTWEHRWRIRTKAGETKWLQSYGSPSISEEESVCWNTLILDVTEQQEAQEALAQSNFALHEIQKMESVGRLAGGVAHDFNNLLSIIIGSAECIDTKQLSKDDEEAVVDIISAAEQGADLSQRLLNFARRANLSPIKLDLAEELSRFERLVRRAVPPSIAIQSNVEDGIWDVMLDLNMFENALLNLVINAADAMQDGGTITIEARNHVVDGRSGTSQVRDLAKGDYVLISVADDGAGISPDISERIFEPFFTTKGETQGAGLGLSMVQGFVKQSKGTIDVVSEVGNGTTFTLYFPT